MKNQESRWLHFLVWAKEYAKNNPIVAIGFVSTGSGGLLLLWYCCLIGQIPEFTLGDVTGLFAAAFVTGVLVVGALSFSYVAPAIVSRYLLEQVLPEKPEYAHVFDKRTQTIEPTVQAFKTMRSEIFSPSFLFAVTALPVLIFSLLLPSQGVADFIWPVDPTLVKLIMLLQLVFAVVLVIFGNEIIPWIRNTLRLLLCFGFCALVFLYLSHRVGLDPTHPLLPTPDKASPQDEDNSIILSTSLVRPYVYVIVIFLATFATYLLAKVEMTGERNRRIKDANAGPPRQPTAKPSMRVARLAVAVPYTFFSLLPLMLALQLAQANGPAHAVRALGLMIAYLAMFNVMYFQLVNVRRQLWISGLAAIGVFFATSNMASQSMAMIPKAPVNALELGNFRASSISLSSTQCSSLALYGVKCEPKKDEAITLTNVNILSRIGSTVVLELQVRRDEPGTTHQPLALPARNDSRSASDVLNRTVLHTSTDALDYTSKDHKATLIKARNCDAATASWLRAPWTDEPLRSMERDKYDRLRCVTISMPKSQLLSYTREGTRNYRGEFSEFVQMQSISKSK
ncbi:MULTISPECIES: hypothetical protein [Burkholderia]|uniref:hypothetical protein n=1 Tax=Burkholderia TaxID=32008 RepID=UPI000A9208E6|nr:MULTISPECIES: hypothetical protein [Burkholderia]QFS40169.1 hypothetical protein BURCE16_25620 [Burkholderia cepacia]UQO36792.1 hypothetical protein L0Z22_29530 [Burkholderia cepacia]UQO51119.1 hypothetical protein L0Z05_35660 [Burkholderia cepacia]UQP05277.1 hypothetical protein L0Z01_12470 [Burkholderia cepacia]